MSLTLFRADVIEVLVKMELAPYQFHLTGSRFFGRATPGSDWDFFVEFNPDLEGWLICNGFYQESSTDYASADISEVWKHVSFPIHVQVISDARLKADVQNHLQNYSHTLYGVPKEYRKAIWNLAFDLFQTGQRQAAELF